MLKESSTEEQFEGVHAGLDPVVEDLEMVHITFPVRRTVLVDLSLKLEDRCLENGTRPNLARKDRPYPSDYGESCGRWYYSVNTAMRHSASKM